MNYEILNVLGLSEKEFNEVKKVDLDIKKVERLFANKYLLDAIKNISEESLVNYFTSKEFCRELKYLFEDYEEYKNFDLSSSEYLKSIFELINDENKDKVFSNLSKKYSSILKFYLIRFERNEEFSFDSIVSIIDYIQNPKTKIEDREYAIKMLEIKFGLNDIDLDLSQYYKKEGKIDLIGLDEFKEKISEYYSNISENEKFNFVYELQRYQGEYPSESNFDTNNKEAINHMRLFAAIKDDSKYHYVRDERSTNILYGILKNNIVKDDEKIKILLKNTYINHYGSTVEFNNVAKKYLKEIDEGNIGKLDVDVNRVIDLLDDLVLIKSERENLFLKLAGIINLDRILEYLKEDPYAEFEILNGLKKDDIYELLNKTKNKNFKSKLLSNVKDYVIGYNYKNIISIIDYINNSEIDNEEKEKVLKILELKFSEKDIKLDLNKINVNEENFKMHKSEEFIQKINDYYSKLSNKEKREFMENAQYGYDIENNVEMIAIIDDEKKCSYIRDGQILDGLLRCDKVSDEEKIIALIRLEKGYNNEYSQAFLCEIKDGKRKKLNVSVEHIVKCLADLKIKDQNSELLIGLAGAIDPRKVIEFLAKKPEDNCKCINALTFEDTEELIEGLDDERYKAKLLLNVNNSAAIISDFFPFIEDDFIRNQIIIAKTTNDRFNGETNSLEKIEEFLSIKEKFLEMSEKERVDFLVNFSKEYDENKGKLNYKDRNDLKNSFLELIPDFDDKERVIESLEYFVEPEIEPLVNLANNMIWEFFEDNKLLSQEEWIKLAKVVRTSDCYYEYYDNYITKGEANHIDRTISIDKNVFEKKDFGNLIFYMLHERAHAMSNFDFLKCANCSQVVFEEGMADTFAELVINHYFTKHKSAMLYGEEVSPQIPFESKSGYHDHNGWVKSMLYPLEERDGQDLVAVSEYLLGDKSKFFDLCMGKGTSDKFRKNYLGIPQDILFTDEDLINANGESYRNLTRNSKYMINNNRIRRLSELAKRKYAARGVGKRAEEERITGEEVSESVEAFNAEMEEEREDEERGDE